MTGNLLVGGVYPDDFKPVLIAPAEAASPREAHIGRVHVATGETESGDRRRPDGPDPHGSLFVEGRGYVEEDVRVGSSLGVGHRFGTPDASGVPPVPYDTPSDILGPFAGLYGGDATSPGIEPRGHLHVRGEIYVESDARFARSLGLGHVRTGVGYTAAERDDILGPEPERFETASERVETPGVFADGAARRGFVHIRGETYVEEDVRIYRGLGLGHVRIGIGDTATARDEILGPSLAALPPKKVQLTPAASLRDGSGRGGTLHVRGETYLEEDVRALRNFGVGHVRIAIGNAPADRDEVLGGTLPTLSAKTAVPSATAMRTGADRGGNVHVRGETYLEEDVRALRNFGVGHVRITSGTRRPTGTRSWAVLCLCSRPRRRRRRRPRCAPGRTGVATCMCAARPTLRRTFARFAILVSGMSGSRAATRRPTGTRSWVRPGPRSRRRRRRPGRRCAPGRTAAGRSTCGARATWRRTCGCSGTLGLGTCAGRAVTR